MEVKSGYKQTEVGILPETWEIKTLGELTTLLTNGFVGTATTHYTEADNGVTYIQGFNVEENSFNLTGIKKVSREFHELNSKSHLREGDLLTIQTGDVGLTTIVPKEFEGANCHALIISRFKKEKAFPKFFSQYFNSPFCRQRLKNIETGTTMKHLNVTDMLKFQLPLPPLPEQRAIAAALSNVDSLLSAFEALLAKKRLIKQGAMQELLTGKKHLSGFADDWETKKFSDLVTVRKQKINPRTSKESLFCVELEHIEQGTGRLVGSTETDNIVSIKSVFRKGDVLFGKLRAYLRKYWLADRDGVCTTEIWPLIPNPGVVVKDYLFQLVQTDGFIETASIAYGTHMPRTDWNVVKNYEFFVPNVPEQTAIAEILSDMDAEIAALESRREKTRLLKQGMMQELLTGMVRLV